jgi:hypothetical protein
MSEKRQEEPVAEGRGELIAILITLELLGLWRISKYNNDNPV